MTAQTRYTTTARPNTPNDHAPASTTYTTTRSATDGNGTHPPRQTPTFRKDTTMTTTPDNKFSFDAADGRLKSLGRDPPVLDR